MKRRIHLFLLLCVAVSLFPVAAEQVTKEQVKGLDEQVQDIKKDVLGISSELSLLEEKLLFPSNTQISIFVSLADGVNFEPDAIKLKLDDKNVADHIYSFKEVNALKRGGVQRVYTGNVQTGEHKMQVSVIGKSGGNKESDTGAHSVTKGVGPQFVEIRLTGAGVEFRDW
ncbi:MAG: hypothetical protein P8079_06290 [Gammaproteobacteria bacterium]|jgi:hypothetical protein